MNVPRTIRASVIVPTHNRAELIPAHVAALLNQDYHDYEIIYVNDGSTDETPAILEAAELEHPGRIKVIGITGAGPGRARNAGAAAASGEVLLFLDDDAFPPSNWLSAMVAAQTQHACDVVCGGIKPYRMETIAERYLYHRMTSGLGSKPKRVSAVPSLNLLVTRRAFEAVNGFRNEYLVATEDWDICRRLTSAGFVIQYDPTVAVVHRFRDDVDSARALVHTQGATGIPYSRWHYRSVAAYAAYSLLRSLVSPVWLLWRYPLDLYGFALRMEYYFARARFMAWLESMRARA